ncbi:DUF7059 domain-containing protein [Micrococcus lylae]|uniref:DUF7059 domain-containing protein n=1 Tax=Micrococcus lylae TaxID=1273 RepID=UPI000C80A4A8|nr:methyltransferase [Micrococcus lylae]WIK81310.1 methyltransferase [Micrococcus lylae]
MSTASPVPAAPSGTGSHGAAPSGAVPPAPSLTPTTAARLAADLAALPYTTGAVEALLGPMAVSALDREHAEAARAVLAAGVSEPDCPLAAMAGAFMLGDPVPAADLAAAVPALGLDGLREAGLLMDAHPGDPEGTVRAACDLSPYDADEPGPMWVASDQTALQRRGPLPAEHVLGVGRASLTLAGAVQRREVDTALDLGTGCGIQTLHLLAHARHVTATDLAPRCLDYTRFNLLLNADVLGLDRENLGERVELLAGDMLTPVAGRRFDMVVSNPPFVITPRTDPDAPVMVYRDGGREGDRLVAEFISAIPALLNPGGTAQMLANWEIPAAESGADDGPLASASAGASTASAGASSAESWDARPRRWVAEGAAAVSAAEGRDVPVQAWIIQRDLQDAAGYAETWLQDSSLELDPEQYQRRYAQYLADFAARGVRGVGFGHVWLRRPAADGSQAGAWTHTEELTQPIDDAIGGAWAAAVARRDRLAAGRGADRAEATDHGEGPAEATDHGEGPAGGEGAVVGKGAGVDPALATLRSLHLTVAADVTEERHQRFGAEHPEVILARQGAGFRRTARLDTATAGLLAASDGELTVGQIVGALGALLELDERAQTALLVAVRELYEDGFLVEVG